jgi:hypothetical protein
VIIQCHKRQSWGHSAANCFAKTKCLKCAGQHLTSECKLKKDNEADQLKIKCANCGEGHLANSTDCLTYQSRRAHLEKIRSAASEKRSNKIKKNVTYVPAPLPTTNPWTTHQTLPSRISELEPTQPVTTENKDEASYNDLVVVMTEIRKLNEIITDCQTKKLWRSVCANPDNNGSFQ